MPDETTKPTIEELEALLNQDPTRLRAQINSDGSVRVIEVPIIHDLSILDEADTVGRQPTLAFTVETLPDFTSTVRDIRLRWAIKHYGGIGPATQAAQARAIQLLRADEDSSIEWAERFMRVSATERHMGDCGLARSWEQGPITCCACVYDEFMLRAWHELQKETGNG